MEDQTTKHPTFNGRDERQGIKEAAQEERASNTNDVANTENELSLGDSERNYGEVSGTTFGIQSNTAKFSNIGAKNQGIQGNASLNEQDRAAGSGGTGYSSYLNEAQQELISGTEGNDSGSQLDTKPFDAMQGNTNNSGNSGS